MMDLQYINVEKMAPGITCLTLNRPDKRNALNLALLIEFCQQLHSLAASQTERVLILQGAGSTFCAGMDLHEAQDHYLSEALAKAIREALTTLYSLPLVTIAAVHGIAAGGGAGLLAACDIVLATPETQISFPEVRRGLVAAQVATFLIRQLPMRDVRELLLVGSLIDAERAHQMRLVNHVAALADLLPMAHHIANEILEGAPDAVKMTKRLLENLAPTTLERDSSLAFEFAEQAKASPEAQEGMRAFLEKRKPIWI